MMRTLAFRRLRRDRRGSMAIETALVAPILALMALGTFEVTNVVSRQQDLQSAANEATTIILAAANGSGIDSAELESILEESLHASPNLRGSDVVLKQLFRCDASATVSETPPTCPSGKPIYVYVELKIADSYTPMWTQFGVGGTIDYDVVRTVQVS